MKYGLFFANASVPIVVGGHVEGAARRAARIGVARLVIGPPGFDPAGLRRGPGEFAERFVARG